MTPDEATLEALTGARRNRPGVNDRQKPSRRVQLTRAVTFATLVLEEAAAGTVDPERAALVLNRAVRRAATPKPPRRQQLPRPGRTPRLTAATLAEVTAVTAAADAIARR